MKSIALVSLDCVTGLVNRYLRVEGNKPVKTGDAQFEGWDPTIEDPGMWAKVWEYLQIFRVGYIPPEDPKPRPTGPKRDEIRIAA